MHIKISRFFNFHRCGGLLGHFSRYGEDVFLRKFFRMQKNGIYINAGAHYTFHLSNTSSADKAENGSAIML